jgi:hypothetical protein
MFELVDEEADDVGVADHDLIGILRLTRTGLFKIVPESPFYSSSILDVALMFWSPTTKRYFWMNQYLLKIFICDMIDTRQKCLCHLGCLYGPLHRGRNDSCVRKVHLSQSLAGKF